MPKFAKLTNGTNDTFFRVLPLGETQNMTCTHGGWSGWYEGGVMYTFSSKKHIIAHYPDVTYYDTEEDYENAYKEAFNTTRYL